MKKLTVLGVTLGISIVTGIAGVKFSAGVWTTLQTILLEYIFGLTIEIWLTERGVDPIFGDLLKIIKKNSKITEIFKTILDATNILVVSKHDFLKKKSVDFLEYAKDNMSKLSRGVIEIDLGPGGRLFRELHAIDVVEKRYYATTRADPLTYWESDVGKSLLAHNQESIQKKGAEVVRIFIYPSSQFETLKSAIERNKAAGVQVLVVDEAELNSRYLKDFGVADDGQFAVQLDLNERNIPERATFYFPGDGTSDEKIKELLNIWEELKLHAKAV